MENNQQQDLIYRLSLFEQQIQQLQQQMQAVEQVIIDLNSLNLEIEELKGAEGKEIFAHLGRGIFAKAKLISEDLLVDVGGKNFVKKDIDGTKKILNEQIKKLEEVKSEISKAMEKVNEELTRIFMEAQKKETDNKKQ